MDTDAPEIVLPGGAALRGAWEESLGSCLFFSAAPLPGAPPAAPRPAHPRWQPQPPGARYHCHTERRLRFSAPAPPRAPPQVPAGSPRPALGPPRAAPGGAALAQAAAPAAAQAPAQVKPAAQAVLAAPRGTPEAAAQAPAGAPAAAAAPATAAPTSGGGSITTPALPCAGPMSGGERSQAEQAAGSGLGYARPARLAGDGNTEASAGKQDGPEAGAGEAASLGSPTAHGPGMRPEGEGGGAERMAEDSAERLAMRER